LRVDQIGARDAVFAQVVVRDWRGRERREAGPDEAAARITGTHEFTIFYL